ncbi:MAG: GGDEF domain-containing protein [Chloroflexales bacterium]
MRTLIRRWLAPPVFQGDEEKTRLATMLNASISTTAIYLMLLTLGNTLGGKTPADVILMDVGGIFIHVPDHAQGAGPRRVERLEAELREQALRDPLTGLYNRRYLSETLAREIARAGREGDSLSLIVSDIDHFKPINDTYGHQAGDAFLIEVAQLMRHCARESDVVCRYGGEEFLLVLPGATLVAAAERAEEIRRRCAELTLRYEGKDLTITMSFGVATFPDHGQAVEAILIKADKTLYMSKHAGRNRVTAWSERPARPPRAGIMRAMTAGSTEETESWQRRPTRTSSAASLSPAARGRPSSGATPPTPARSWASSRIAERRM